MQKLEKIINEIEQHRKKAANNGDFNVAAAHENDMDIIRKHMNDGWIPVEERLSERNKTVLVCQRGGAIDVAWHDGYRWKTGFSHADWLLNVIAWRPLPEPYRPERSKTE